MQRENGFMIRLLRIIKINFILTYPFRDASLATTRVFLKSIPIPMFYNFCAIGTLVFFMDAFPGIT